MSTDRVNPDSNGFHQAVVRRALRPFGRAFLSPGRLLQAIGVYVKSCCELEALAEHDFRDMPIDRHDIYAVAFRDAMLSLKGGESCALAAVGWALLLAAAAGVALLC
jgi:uncharacterized protein YjiS (DUF1127 family)